MAKKTTKEANAAFIKNSALPTEQKEPVEKILPADSYFAERMASLGIRDPKKESFAIPKGANTFWHPIFTPSPTDDVIINYPALEGMQETYIDGDEVKPFTRIRYNPNKNRDNKYGQPAGSGTHIFFPVEILDKYEGGCEIETLILVEGEFKAQAGSMHGLDIVGLGGKDLFTDGDKDLHIDILRIIDKCKVRNLVLLLDADIFALNWDKETEPDKNLSKRLNGFCNTVIKFREVAKSKVKDCYFAHVSERFLHTTKGLDDLFFDRHGSEPQIVNDLLKLKLSKAFFSTINLSADTIPLIKKYFGLILHKGVPAAFYGRHMEEIGDQEFNFFGTRYKYFPNDGLKLVKDADSFKFIRVGCDYFKIITVPNTNKEGVLDTKRVPWKKAEITQDYVHEKGLKNFLSTIDKYDAFCNVPDNTGQYEPVISGCFNLYSKLDHLPEAGKWETIEGYLKHVFGEAKTLSGYTNYEIALDYLQLIYLRPRQKLPIVALVNRLKNTGKSTFLWLLKEIFQANCTFIGNEELKDHLNDDWADKLIVGIDEGFIDKKSVLERLKSMSTASTIKLRGMYAGRQEIPFFAKFVMTSNDEDNFAPIDKDEVRFWVNKVPVITKDDPDLLDKMILEIPAFLDYLQNRTLLHKKESRHWFNPAYLDTEAGKAVKNSSRSWVEKEIRVIMKDLFFEYRYHTLAYTITELMDLLNSANAGVKFRKADVVEQLQARFNMSSKHARYSFPDKIDNKESALLGQTFTIKHSRCYEFFVEDFLSPEEMRKEFSQIYKKHQIDEYRETRILELESVDADDLPF